MSGLDGSDKKEIVSRIAYNWNVNFTCTKVTHCSARPHKSSRGEMVGKNQAIYIYICIGLQYFYALALAIFVNSQTSRMVAFKLFLSIYSIETTKTTYSLPPECGPMFFT